MGETTAISWTEHTFNPWWGCVKVSAECSRCYAETFAKRTGHGVWGETAPRRLIGDKTWNDPLRWARQADIDIRPHLVFCASMADVFEAVPAAAPMVDAKGIAVPGRNVVTERRRLWDLIEATAPIGSARDGWQNGPGLSPGRAGLRWQLLTKRPENVLAMVPPHWLEDWPPHVWMGTTVGNQESAEERIPHLLRIPAPVRFISGEPLLERVDMRQWLYHSGWQRPGIHWVICGGESGPKYRPLNLDWARDLRDQCAAAEVPFWFKQVGGLTPAAGGAELDGEVTHQFPVSFQHELDQCA